LKDLATKTNADQNQAECNQNLCPYEKKNMTWLNLMLETQIIRYQTQPPLWHISSLEPKWTQIYNIHHIINELKLPRWIQISYIPLIAIKYS
jgi:hypothetical protein